MTMAFCRRASLAECCTHSMPCVLLATPVWRLANELVSLGNARCPDMHSMDTGFANKPSIIFTISHIAKLALSQRGSSSKLIDSRPAGGA